MSARKNNTIKFLYLSQEDMVKAGVLDMRKCVKTIEKGFELMGKGDFVFGGPDENEHGIMIWFPKKPRGPNMPIMGPDRRFMAMVGYLGGEFNVCGEKWYGSNVKNPKERGLPRSILLVVLNDPLSAKPLAIMDGTLISAMRTGAVPGVGAKYLARKDSEVVGIIGAGVINRACLMSLADVLKYLKEVKVFDIVKSKSEAFSEEMSGKLRLNVHPVDCGEEAVEKSDVISVAAAGPELPVIRNEWLKEGCYLPLSGAIAPEEDIYLNSKVVMESWKMHQGWIKDMEERKKIEPEDKSFENIASILVNNLIKKGKIKESDIVELPRIIVGKEKGRTNDKEKIVLVTGGLPMEDIAWGYAVYKEALKRGIGKKLTLWKTPHWI